MGSAFDDCPAVGPVLLPQVLHPLGHGSAGFGGGQCLFTEGHDVRSAGNLVADLFANLLFLLAQVVVASVPFDFPELLIGVAVRRVVADGAISSSISWMRSCSFISLLIASLSNWLACSESEVRLSGVVMGTSLG